MKIFSKFFPNYDEVIDDQIKKSFSPLNVFIIQSHEPKQFPSNFHLKTNSIHSNLNNIFHKVKTPQASSSKKQAASNYKLATTIYISIAPKWQKEHIRLM